MANQAERTDCHLQKNGYMDKTEGWKFHALTSLSLLTLCPVCKMKKYRLELTVRLVHNHLEWSQKVLLNALTPGW